MTATPAPGSEPNRPQDGTLAPTAPGQPLTSPQKILTGIVVGAVLIIASLGFIGSYSAVTRLALAKGFGEFAHAFPLAVDAGIIAFLALDLLLTWRRIPYPLLRYTAWALTAATIAFNAVVAWPDPVGTGMHGVIPILFVIAVEAARHAIGRLAEIVADKHLEGPNTSRWFLNPIGTFVLWRRQRLWAIRRWETVLELERERRIYIGKLRREHGRGWRRKATAEQLLVLWLATKNGMSIADAIELPAREEEKRRQEEDRIARDKQRADDERRREQQAYERDQQRLEDERAQKAEDDRLERERQQLELEQQRAAAARQQQIEDAEARARLADIARSERDAAAAVEARHRQQQIEDARRLADEQQRAANAATARAQAEEAARREAERKLAASERAADMLRAASASQTAASRPANASRATATSDTGQAASRTASAASSTTASTATANDQSANASANQAAANGASAVDIDHVVTVYQLLKDRDGTAPSDQKLGDALGVSRSRAQQLRTAAINAGHTQLAKPVRLAS